MYIMLSIYPEYANKIFTGHKAWEYRKSLPKAHSLDINGVVVYATAPVSQVIGHFETDLRKAVGAVPDNLWRMTNGATDGGITKEAFDKYFEGHTYGYAIPVAKTVRYVPGENCVQPTLEDFGLKKPPQGFAYLTKVKNFLLPNTRPMAFNTLLAYCEERKTHIELTNVVITPWLGGKNGELDVKFDWTFDGETWGRVCGKVVPGVNRVNFAVVDGHCTLIINPNNEEVKRIIDDTETRETIKYYFAHNVYDERAEKEAVC